MTSVSHYPSVEKLLYHEPPMVLIDRFVEKIENGARCEVDIHEGALFFENGGIPAFVGIEYMAQTIGVYAGAVNYDLGQCPQIGFLLGGQRVSLFCDFYKNGQTLLVEAKKTWDGGNLVQFECSVKDKYSNEILAQANVNCYSPERLLDKEEG